MNPSLSLADLYPLHVAPVRPVGKPYDWTYVLWWGEQHAACA